MRRQIRDDRHLMDEHEARRLLAIAADDSDRPPMPALWPELRRRRLRRARMMRTGRQAMALVSVAGVAIAGLKRARRHRE
jgi:hypothetical protein